MCVCEHLFSFLQGRLRIASLCGLGSVTNLISNDPAGFQIGCAAWHPTSPDLEFLQPVTFSVVGFFLSSEIPVGV